MQQIILKNFRFIINPSKNQKLNALKNIDRLVQLLFSEQLTVIKTDQAFIGYAMAYKVEIIQRKDPNVQLEAGKLSIKDLFSDHLNE